MGLGKKYVLIFGFVILATVTGYCQTYELMSSDQFLTLYRSRLAPKHSSRFVPLKNTEVGALFYELELSLRQNHRHAAERAREQLAMEGFLVQLIELEAEELIVGYLEGVTTEDPQYKGFGAFLCKPFNRNRFSIQCVHPKSDRYTEYISLDAFLAIRQVTYLHLTGSHRYANPDTNNNGFADSDTAHEQHNRMTLWTEQLCEPWNGSYISSPAVIQFHGAYDRPTEPDIVASYGSDYLPEKSYFLEEVNDLLETVYPGKMGVCGYREPFTSQIEDGVYELCASNNVQGLAMADAGYDSHFMHLEIERHVRNDYMNGFGSGYDMMHSLFDIIESLLLEINLSQDSRILMP